jgi:hypothetical protein
MEMWTVVVGDFPKDYKIDSFYRQQDAITGDDAGRSAAEARAIALNSGGAK